MKLLLLLSSFFLIPSGLLAQDNSSIINQNGLANVVISEQEGNNKKSKVTQLGDTNKSEVSQPGSNNFSLVREFGNENKSITS
jgi:hypothetical protein